MREIHDVICHHSLNTLMAGISLTVPDRILEHIMRSRGMADSQSR